MSTDLAPIEYELIPNQDIVSMVLYNASDDECLFTLEKWWCNTNTSHRDPKIFYDNDGWDSDVDDADEV